MGCSRQPPHCRQYRGGDCRGDGDRPPARQDPVKAALGVVLALGFALALAGCGYHVSGKSNKLPTNLRILAIPAFTNGSQVYRVEQDLTSAVVRAFITRTHYQIINRQDGSAGATLQGTVLGVTVFPLPCVARSNRVA